jgi:hypothetical protein
MLHLDEGVLHALLDGEIPSAELAPIQAHLAGCAECQAALDEARALRAESEALVEVIQVPEEMPGVAAPRLRSAPRPAWGRRLAWAASLVLAVGLGYVARPLGPGFVRNAVVTQAPAAVTREPSVPAAAAEPTAPAASPPKESPMHRAATRTTPRENRALAEVEKKPSPRMADSQAAAGAVSGRVAANAVAVPPAPAPAAETKTVVAGVAPATPAAPAGDVTARFSQSMKQSLRLEELVVTGAQESRDMAKLSVPVIVIQFPDAVRRLGGTLRLVEGMVPLRIEAQGPMVRIIYPAARGELILAQWLSDGRLTWTLSGPPGFPADSLDRLRARVRE